MSSESELHGEFASKLKEKQNASPYYKHLGMMVSEIGRGYSRLTMQCAEKLTGRFGMIHGGALASLADSAMAVSLMSMFSLEDRVASIEMKINFVSPVSSGEVTAEGRVLHIGRTIGTAECEIKNQEGRLVAKAIGTYAIIRR